MKHRDIAPIHPGEHLGEFFAEFGIDTAQAATALRIPASRIEAILSGKQSITADTALRLGRYFGTSAAFWMTLQDNYELEQAIDAIGGEIERIARVA